MLCSGRGQRCWLLVTLAFACIAGCAAPPNTHSGAAPFSFVLEVAPPSGGSPNPPEGVKVAPDGGNLPVATAQSPPAIGLPPTAVIATTAGSTTASQAAGGGSDPTSTPRPDPATTAFVTLGDGRTLAFPAGDTVSLPAAIQGDVVLDAPGRVSSSVVASGLPLVLHPSLTSIPAAPTGHAHITGTISPPDDGVLVQFLTAGRVDYMGTTTVGGGTFDIDTRVDIPTKGIVVARDAGDAPRLALTRVTADPTAVSVAGTLALQAASPPSSPYGVLGVGDPGPTLFPTVPAGMAYDTTLLQVIEDETTTPWAANLVGGPGLALPTYTLPGFTQVVLLRATSADGLRSSTTVGPPGAWDTPLAAPDLSSITAPPLPGGHLSWPPVPGATLYVVRLYAYQRSGPPLWEGATAGTSLAVPSTLAGLENGATLQVGAWAVPNLTVYSIASLGQDGPRQLRVPSQPLAVRGRRSVATRYFPVQ